MNIEEDYKHVRRMWKFLWKNVIPMKKKKHVNADENSYKEEEGCDKVEDDEEHDEAKRDEEHDMWCHMAKIT